jgi:hypothetical protein
MLVGTTIAVCVLALAPAQPSVDLPTDLAVPAQPPQPILGGEPTGPNEFDGVVAIVAGTGLCTGTVVAPRLILTAGHCLRDIPASTGVHVYYGDALNPHMGVPAIHWGMHPDFCADCGEDIFDYGYVTIDVDFTVPGGYQRPIVDQHEWDEAIAPGAEVTLVGYGDDPSTPNSIGVKRKVATTIRRLSEKGLEFFAGGDDRDSCQGDSGGPAFAKLADGTVRLAGITSRGSTPCGSGGFYGTPYPALCWVRDETGVDMLQTGCDSCDCLRTVEPEGCSVEPRRSTGTGALASLLILVLHRRRRRKNVSPT